MADHTETHQHNRQRQKAIAPTIVQSAQPDPSSNVDVGRRIREIRTEREISIRSLAELSGLNVNTLSLIENGKTSPSVSTLQRIAGALELPITAFFEVKHPRKNMVFQKAGQSPCAVFTYGTIEDLGSGLTLRGGQPLLVTLKPQTDSGPDRIVHTGHEFIYCLDGYLQYDVEDKTFLLEPGDSLIFEAHLPHRWSNSGTIAARALLIICPTDENDQPTERHFVQANESE